ncbi:MAG TPA: hypothetical protein VMV87_18690, partial [Burkholderiales bacterium]|nr:hypothetical protein [Burkholderiales bacterium]
MKDAGSNLTAVAEYTQTAAALAELRQKFGGLVVDVSTPKGLKEAKACTYELRMLRTALEKKRAELKAPILARGKLLDDEAKRITAEIRAMEEPIDVQIKAEESRIESERLEKLEAERLRAEAIQRKIQAIRDVPASLVGKPSVIIAGQLAKLRETVLDEADLGEYHIAADDALLAAIARTAELLDAQKDIEAEQARVRAEREELERMRAENARLQREAEERAEADRREQDRLAQVERDRLAAIERGKAMEAAAAERDRLAAERAEQEAAMQAERERQAAEQRKLDEQADKLKREQRAAKEEAERVRLAGLGLREAAQAVVSARDNGGN